MATHLQLPRQGVFDNPAAAAPTAFRASRRRTATAAALAAWLRLGPIAAYRGGEQGHERRPDGPPAAGEAAGDAAGAASEQPPAWATRLLEGQARIENGQAKLVSAVASVFETAVRSSHPASRGPIVVSSLEDLAQLCQLPASPHQLQPAYEALAQPLVLHCFREQLLRFSRKSRPQAGKEGQYAAAVTVWYAAPPKPSSEVAWCEEEAHAAKVLACFVPNSPPHSAFTLWRSLCAAAAQDAACLGSSNAVLSLLHATPEPLMWQPAVALLAALVDACQPEFELDLPVLVSRTGTGVAVTVEEIKLGAAGVGIAKVKLARIVRLMAWLHAALGQPQPEFVGSVVVPAAQRQEAQRRLGRSLKQQLSVPQGHGTVHVTWQLSAA